VANHCRQSNGISSLPAAGNSDVASAKPYGLSKNLLMFLFALFIDWINVFGRSTRKAEKRKRMKMRKRADASEFYFTTLLLALHTRTISQLSIRCDVTS
jgi:hypothetical protein